MGDREERLQIPTPSPSPWLVYTHGKSRSKKIQTFCTLTTCSNNNKYYYIKSIPALRDKRILGSSHGWLILQHLTHNNNLYLWNYVTSNLIDLAPINASDFDPAMSIKSCILTCSPLGDDTCIVLVFCESFVFAYQLNHDQQCGNRNWVSQRLELKGVKAEIKQTIMTKNGVIYACAYTYNEECGVIKHLITLNVDVTDYNNSVISVTLGPFHLGFPYPDHSSFPNYNRMGYSMLESAGLVYLLGAYMLPCDEYYRITGIKIWHLDLENVTWVEVDSLGDRAFFLDCNKGSTWCWANNEAGVEPNSVYILVPEEEGNVYMYRLHDRSLTPLCPCPNLVEPWDSPAWVVMPHHHQRSSPGKLCDQQVNDIVDSEKLLDLDQNRTLDDLISLLPTELIILISKHLHMFDYLSFREACKSFRSQLPLPEWRSHNALPLFLFSKKDGGLCQIMDPCRNDSRFFSVPLPSRFEKFIDFSKNGWLLFGVGGDSLKYFNIFTGVSGDFPSFEQIPDQMPMQALQSLGFSTCPTSSDCLTVGIYAGCGYVFIAYHHYGEKSWQIVMFELMEFEFTGGISSPVFVDGKFYFLDQSGQLGVFELEEGKPDITFYGRPELKCEYFNSNHLLECDGQILSVFIGDIGTWVQVFRFSHSDKEWVKLEDLRDNILFINHSTSFSAAAPEPGIGNRIYFPRLYHNDIVYYSLETGKFHTFGNEHAMDDLYGTEEQLRCCWV